MKKESILLITLVAFLSILGGIFLVNKGKDHQNQYFIDETNYSQRESYQKELNLNREENKKDSLQVHKQNLKKPHEKKMSSPLNERKLEHTEKKDQSLPELVREPYTRAACEAFLRDYHCQEGVDTAEGRVDCNPSYLRTETRCQYFLNGDDDPYGNNYGI